MKLENGITVNGVENVKFTPATERESKDLYVEEKSKLICSVRFTYIDYLNLKDDRIAECFLGVKIEANVLPWVNCYAEELVQLSWEYSVTLQSIVDNFTDFLSVGLRPEMSLHRVKETLNIPGSYKLLMRGDQMNNILINPKTGKEYQNVPVRVAAEFLSTSPQAVRDGILGKTLPIGAVALNAGGKPRFIIPPERLKSWKNGYDLNISAAEKLLEKIKITAQVTADESNKY